MLGLSSLPLLKFRIFEDVVARQHKITMYPIGGHKPRQERYGGSEGLTVGADPILTTCAD